MKKIRVVLAAAVLAAGLLSGCSGSKSGVKLEENKAVIEDIGVYVAIPEGWEVYTGSDIYRAVAEESSKSAEKLKSDDEQAGTRFLLLAKNPENTMTIQVTAQDIASDGSGGILDQPMTPEEYARACHDTALFDYFASGFRSGGDSVFEETAIDGFDGWHSYYEIFLSEEEGGSFLCGQSEFLFSAGGEVYSVQTSYITPDCREAAAEIGVFPYGSD